MGILKSVPQGKMHHSTANSGVGHFTSIPGAPKVLIDHGMNSRPTSGKEDLKSSAPMNPHTLDRNPPSPLR